MKITLVQRWLITIGVMSTAVLQALDSTIVNVALPHMEKSFGVAPDQITWVLTSYLVSAGIFMPLTGYLNDRLGRKTFLLGSIFGFIAASALCGIASSLSQMVLFRILQGILGAALVPLSQAILVDIYPEKDRGKAMALWGGGVMIGPILGPTLGGYLTEIFNWRWSFYINIPIGMAALLLVWYTLPTFPRKSRSLDWVGLLFMALAISCTQYTLDRGNQDGWFNDPGICLAFALAASSLIIFIIHSLRKNGSQSGVFDLRIFKDRNFSIASCFLAIFSLGMFGSLVILPLMLETLLNYPVLETGLILASRGVSGMVGMIVVSNLIRTIDSRILITFGILLAAIGSFIGIFYNFNITAEWVIWPLLLQGFGLSMIFVPLSSIAFSTLPMHLRAEAAGLFSLLRVLGASIGISIVITIFARHTQNVLQQIEGLKTPRIPYVSSLRLAETFPLVNPTLFKQAQMVAFIDVFIFITVCFVLMLPLVLLLRK